ncbi:hypothetical protein ACUN0C_06900 [Faunimonas sp. B44]|uniref:hypothetical protein n=1 Tax=Faunimonas sp. B44 TaxID=3461493 RepID=UPI004043DE41
MANGDVRTAELIPLPARREHPKQAGDCAPRIALAYAIADLQRQAEELGLPLVAHVLELALCEAGRLIDDPSRI